MNQEDKSTEYGSELEDKGWLQGAIIERDEAISLLQSPSTQCIDVSLDELLGEDFVLVVVSQSCDIANNYVNTVQLLVARAIPNRKPQFAYNAHPRLLDTYFTEMIPTKESTTESGDNAYDAIERSIQLSILEKVFVNKLALCNALFNSNVSWGPQEERSFRNWLGEHYNRPAFPTDFNDLLKETKGVESKLGKAAKQSNEHLYAIYARLSPFRELKKGETYKLQLLGALTNSGEQLVAEEKLNRYADLLRQAGIDVTHIVVRPKTQISMAMLEGMERFHWDKLSYREANTELPPDVQPGL